MQVSKQNEHANESPDHQGRKQYAVAVPIFQTAANSQQRHPTTNVANANTPARPPQHQDGHPLPY
jgi:hypothetical protein